MQEILRQLPDRGTWTSFSTLEPYIQYNISASEVLEIYKSVLNSFGIQTNDEELAWICPPLILLDSRNQQNPYKHRFISGSSKCSTKVVIA